MLVCRRWSVVRRGSTVYHEYRTYYSGNPFRLKTLSSQEIKDLAKERNIASDSFTERTEVLKAIQSELETGNLPVKDAAQVMSFQDVQQQLLARGQSTNGPGLKLRERLREILESEELTASIMSPSTPKKPLDILNDTKQENMTSTVQEKTSTTEKIENPKDELQEENERLRKLIEQLEKAKTMKEALVKENEEYYSSKRRKSDEFSLEDIPNPRKKFVTSSVSDFARLFSYEGDADIENECNLFQEELGNEIAVVTLPSLPRGYTNPKSCATALFNYWRIGNVQENNGLLFLLVVSERRLEIEIGAGLNNTIGKKWLSDMQIHEMVPHFKQGNYEEGILQGLKSLRTHLRRSDPNPSANESFFTRFKNLLLVSAVGLLAAVGGGLYLTRPEKCECGGKLEELTVLEEELEAPFQIEKQMGSCSFKKICCHRCNQTSIKRVPALKAIKCGQCGYYTCVNTQNRVTKEPSFDEEGSKIVSELCNNCGHSSSYTKSIPRKHVQHSSRTHSSRTHSSDRYSSSSSSSSSYGGGNSSGGGSGSSW